MQLSTHFSLEEAVLSQTALRIGIDNTPTGQALDNMRAAAAKMELVRAFLGHPIYVSSWYRSPPLNVRIGGSIMSAHTLGYAIDFRCPGFGTPLETAKAIERKFNYDQLIHEYGNWVHISFDPRTRNQELTIDSRGTRTGLLPARR